MYHPHLLRVCILSQSGFSYVAVYLYLGRFMSAHMHTMGLLLPFVYVMVGGEVKKGEACSVTLFTVSEHSHNQAVAMPNHNDILTMRC
jgi:hypothetical protein